VGWPDRPLRGTGGVFDTGGMTRHALARAVQVYPVFRSDGPPGTAASGFQPGELRLACRVVEVLGGRYSAGLGIDADGGDREVERWFLAATLFGTRISAQVAERTFGVLAGAGLARIAQARQVPSADLIGLLDQGGYARYDFRTAARLVELSETISERFDGQVAVIGRRFTSYPELCAALDALPGWGPVTIGLFLRELRGVWPGAEPPLAERAAEAARHLGLHGCSSGLPGLAGLAAASGLDVRDLESGLVRLTLAHHGGMGSCPGGRSCAAFEPVQARKPGGRPRPAGRGGLPPMPGTWR